MQTIALRVVLHGLMALVPDSSSQATQVTALLVNATQPPGMECMDAHTPVISFSANPQECASAAASVGCSIADSGLCTCNNLIGREITLEMTPAPLPKGVRLDTAPPSVPPSLPPTSATAGSFGYVLNLAKPPFNLTLDSQYTGPAPNGANLAARMIVPIDLLTTCRFVQRLDAEDWNIPTMASWPLGQLGSDAAPVQAAARSVEAEVALPSNVFKVAIHFHKFDGSDDHAVNLLATNSEFQIDLGNEPEPLDPDAPCDDGVARHFDMFYVLSSSQPPSHPVPHVRLQSVLSSTVARPSAPACAPATAGATERPICPMASFAP
jgi:hypothetical protein